MAQPPAVFFEAWNAEIDQLGNGGVTPSSSSFDFAHFGTDDQSMRRLREYGKQLSTTAETEDTRIQECVSTLDSLVRSQFCVADYRQQEIAAQRARLEKLREQQEGDAAMIKRFQRENASLRTRLTTYEEDDGERVRMEEEMRRAKREEEDRLRMQRAKLQQALDIAQGVSSPSVAQLRSRFDSPSAEPTTRRRQPDAARTGVQTTTTTTTRRNNENGPGFYNPKYRRSQSASRVVDHRPAVSIPTGSILKAKMPANSKTTIAPKADLLRNSDGYVLTHQEVDDEGNISTSIFKGDCIPTAGGGTAVCFNDVEHLSHEAPGQSIGKKRKSRSTKKTVRF
ncbi:hypothetical protein PRIPAC_80134 [Pristionchus pacificus]|uniref:MKLP1_Arf_bdg domain-containing protein n=1 Tax=Pristionchus pacificus TaxID=54126 RepID=A0A2A6BHZ5_PRIPA|nr:hypothetical protein PRIPAC_80134 [Pristionchus pacificus]|eukprot:PDM65512.1 hypothetical protein PRIPAC_52454 [Pristionchus pacificus]